MECGDGKGVKEGRTRGSKLRTDLQVDLLALGDPIRSQNSGNWTTAGVNNANSKATGTAERAERHNRDRVECGCGYSNCQDSRASTQRTVGFARPIEGVDANSSH